jgi:hypothetical protein
MSFEGFEIYFSNWPSVNCEIRRRFLKQATFSRTSSSEYYVMPLAEDPIQDALCGRHEILYAFFGRSGRFFDHLNELLHFVRIKY